MIGDTADISLLTGLPGAGKTLRMVEAIVTLVEQGKHVYVCNINGIDVPGTTPWENPHEWEDLPPGAILFVDEAQEYFPARRSGDPVPQVKALSKVRHSAIRIVLATQSPDFLDAYVRKLVGAHEHLYRQAGKDQSFLFRNHQVMENINMPLKRIKTLYDYEKWNLPEKYFKFYTSAQLHTRKYVMPALLKRAIPLGILAVLFFGGVWVYIFGDAWAMKKGADQQVAGAASPGSAQGKGAAIATTATTNRQARPETTEDFARMMLPRVAHQPWSAPVFDSQTTAPRSKPELYCIASGPGIDAQGVARADDCSCMTEQGTRYTIDRVICARIVAQGGVYNPFREPEREKSVSSQEPADQVEPAPVATGATATDQVASYGAFRDTGQASE